jgi:NADPH-dependent glutamate synthase beta subunit-like oxidoreductase
MSDNNLTSRRYKDDDHEQLPWGEVVVSSGESYTCPTYIQRTAPCQNACPSGHDIRGWLSIVSGQDKPPKGSSWQEYAFERMTLSNPFPSIMGRVCPAPCQDSCNRNDVDEFVGINSIEQYIGDWARDNNLALTPAGASTDKKVAIIGGGPAGLAGAYFLRKLGHSATIFEEYSALGGMMRFGLPEFRVPRDILEQEIQRILDQGVEVKLNTRVGTDVTVAELEKEYDAIFWGVGCIKGKSLRVPGAEAPNCVDGMSFLRAFNAGSLKYLSGRILVIGGGDTAMDVVAASKRLGNIPNINDANYPERVLAGLVVHNETDAAMCEDSDSWLVYRRPISKAPCTKQELEACIAEGAEIHDSLAPLEVILDDDGRARALKVQPVDWTQGKMEENGEPFEIECSMIVMATGQTGDFDGIDGIGNEWNQIDAEKNMRVKGKPGHFVGGDAINPALLTTAIGQASIAAEGIDRYLRGEEVADRPKVDGHHFELLRELEQKGLSPQEYKHTQTGGTDSSNFAVHNFENRANAQVVSSDGLFRAHFPYEPRNKRAKTGVSSDNVLANTTERFTGLDEEQAIRESARCMNCGMCLECDNCMVYCPQGAVFRVKKEERAVGRYVETDYSLCVGCQICKDVCPSGYIEMGLGIS